MVSHRFPQSATRPQSEAITHALMGFTLPENLFCKFKSFSVLGSQTLQRSLQRLRDTESLQKVFLFQDFNSKPETKPDLIRGGLTCGLSNTLEKMCL